MKKDRLFELAENYISKTGVSVFLTGKAGTGKTTFLKYIVENTPKRCIVLAPTGVAAVNAGGVTIHSFFSLPLCPYLPDVKELVTEYQMPEAHRQLKKEKIGIIKTLDLLIIDEISMVRADILDAVDATMRRYRHNSLPFGGVQLLMIGDAHQLPPVVREEEEKYLKQVYSSPFFFNAKVMQRLNCITIELQTVYRQSDAQFISILNSIRNGHMDSSICRILNSRLDPRFNPNDSRAASGMKWIRLTTHNRQADAVNEQKMNQLESRPYTFWAAIEGTFPENSYPAEEELTLKQGAQVMFLRNDSKNGRYFNGKIGTVTEIGEEFIIVTDENGDEIDVPLEKWDNIQYEINKETKEIESKVVGTFTQYPLKTAWAVTIHKSQGLTFEHVIIDAASAFTFGQVYVALSRCRTLEGIVLSSPITQACLFTNTEITQFHEEFTSVDEMENGYRKAQNDYFMSILIECFNFQELERLIGWTGGIFRKNLKRIYPVQTETMEKCRKKVTELCGIAKRFQNELSGIGAENREFLADRIAKAADYFVPELADISANAVPLLKINVDNQEIRTELNSASRELLPELSLRLLSLKRIQEHGFSVNLFLETRNGILSDGNIKAKTEKQRNQKTVKEEVEMRDIYADNRHPELIEPLIEWRTEQYMSQDVPAYCILTQKTLLGIADACPSTREELLAVPGFGKAKWDKYGTEILKLIAENMK